MVFRFMMFRYQCFRYTELANLTDLHKIMSKIFFCILHNAHKSELIGIIFPMINPKYFVEHNISDVDILTSFDMLTLTAKFSTGAQLREQKCDVTCRYRARVRAKRQK